MRKCRPRALILIDRELPEADLLAEAFRGGAGGKIEISVPQRGDRRRMMEQAQRNAVEALDRRMAESGTKAKVLRELAEFLELPEVPQRIEVYDNSHIQGTNALGAMIVAGPEGLIKGQYRKWNIKTAQTDDDFAMMREVMERRFGRLLAESPSPSGEGLGWGLSDEEVHLGQAPPPAPPLKGRGTRGKGRGPILS